MEQVASAGCKVGGEIIMRAGAHVGRVAASSLYRVECFAPDRTLKWVEEVTNIVVEDGLNDLLGKYFKASAYTAAHYVGLVGAGAGTVATTAAGTGVTGTGTAFAAADVGSDIIIPGAGTGGADHRTTIATVTSATAITLSAATPTAVSGANYAVEARPLDRMGTKSFAEVTPYSNAARPTLTLGAVASGSVDNAAAKAGFNINVAAPGVRVFGAFVSTDATKGGTVGILYGMALFNTSRPVVDQDVLNVQVTLTAASA